MQFPVILVPSRPSQPLLQALHREVPPELTTGRVVVVTGGSVVVVGGRVVVVGGGAVSGAAPAATDGAGAVVVVAGAVVVVTGAVVVVVPTGPAGGAGGGAVDAEDPGCSRATMTPIKAVSPLATITENRVNPRIRASARVRARDDRRCGVRVIGSGTVRPW